MTQKQLKRLAQPPLARLGCGLQALGAEGGEGERKEAKGISYKAVLALVGQIR